MKKIGLITIATGKYDCFIPQLISSFKEKFVLSCESDIIVLTDSDKFEDGDRVVVRPVEHTDWPMSTLLRFHYFHRYKDVLQNYDYLYFIDCDMVINMELDESILPQDDKPFVGTLHPGFYTDMPNATFETNPNCLAYLPREKRITYYQACFFGAEKTHFLEMCEKIKNNIDIDLSKNIIAIWHDESHLNNYFADKNVLKLHPGHAYPELLRLPFPKNIIHLSKDHSKIRN